MKNLNERNIEQLDSKKNLIQVSNCIYSFSFLLHYLSIDESLNYISIYINTFSLKLSTDRTIITHKCSNCLSGKLSCDNSNFPNKVRRFPVSRDNQPGKLKRVRYCKRRKILRTAQICVNPLRLLAPNENRPHQIGAGTRFTRLQFRL